VRGILVSWSEESPEDDSGLFCCKLSVAGRAEAVGAAPEVSGGLSSSVAAYFFRRGHRAAVATVAAYFVRDSLTATHKKDSHFSIDAALFPIA
jgi:hypothetical protein